MQGGSNSGTIGDVVNLSLLHLIRRLHNPFHAQSWREREREVIPTVTVHHKATYTMLVEPKCTV